ncbi:MAG TPA: hypothetical protein VEF53_08455, partial [Patescibacteria group bacterium]|nr:hypothetical protein [Patescibacteria group bacterium]
MIKTVEKVIYKEKDDFRKLELMLENLAEEMISNEQYINEKATLEQFLNELRVFGADLETLVKGFDGQSKTEIILASMYHYLALECEDLKNKIQRNTEVIEEHNHKLKAIDLEERSYEYYKCKDNLDLLQNEYDEISERLSFTLVELKEAGKRRDIQKAAEIYADVKELEAELVALEEELLTLKGQNKEKEKIRSLEYSLKLGYEKRLNNTNKELAEVTLNIKHQTDKVVEYKDIEKKLDDKIGESKLELGKLIQSKSDFLKYEEKIKIDLGFNINRNLLGEVDPEDIKKIQKTLLGIHETYKEELSLLDRSIYNKRTRQSIIKKEKDDLEIEKAELIKKKEEATSEYTKYKEFEDDLKTILLKHGLDFSKRFNNEELQREFKVIIKGIQQNQYDLRRELSGVHNTIESLKNGTLHVSEEFAQFLEANDINFETGENYLRKQKRDIREGLLHNIPLLPYAFILITEDIEKVKLLYPEHPLYQLIPIISYSNLNVVFDSKGKMLDMGKGTSLLCIYNHRMIDTDSIADYLKELESECEELNIKVAHYTESLEETQKDSRRAFDFKFDRNYLHSIEVKLYTLDKKLEEVQIHLKSHEQEYKENEEIIDTCYRESNAKSRLVDQAERNIKAFGEYVDLNEEYQEIVKKYDDYSSELNRCMSELGDIRKQISDTQETKHKFEAAKNNITKQISVCEDKYYRYRNAPKAEVIEEDIDSMEARLEALQKEVAGTIELKEKEKKRKDNEVSRKNKEIEKLGLARAEYIDVIYDEILHKSLEDEYKEIEWRKQEQEKKEKQLSITMAAADALTKTALSEVKKLSETLTSRSSIRLNFEERRRESKEIIGKKHVES